MDRSGPAGLRPAATVLCLRARSPLEPGYIHESPIPVPLPCLRSGLLPSTSRIAPRFRGQQFRLFRDNPFHPSLGFSSKGED